MAVSTVRQPNARIGQKNESMLHNALKEHYAALPLAASEISLGGFIIDVVTPDQLIEIQTGNFSAMKSKLAALLPQHRICIVYPLLTKVRLSYIDTETGEILSSRSAGRRQTLPQLFDQLIALRDFIGHPHLTLEVVSVSVEELRAKDGRGSWRRKGISIIDRRLLDILDTQVFVEKADYLELLPALPTGAFTNAELAKALKTSDYYAQRITYCLHYLGLLYRLRRQGHAWLYSLTPDETADDERTPHSCTAPTHTQRSPKVTSRRAKPRPI